MLARRLQRKGYEVVIAVDGEEGGYYLNEFSFDLAVVDIGLPKVSGIDLIRAARAGGLQLPILILTARGDWQDKVEGLEAGADDYLVKPFAFPELLARVRALLRRPSRR